MKSKKIKFAILLFAIFINYSLKAERKEYDRYYRCFYAAGTDCSNTKNLSLKRKVEIILIKD